jgi:threonine dehydratase
MEIFKQILKAKKVIEGKINKTPLIFSKNISKKFDAELYLKPEVFQKTGSFKIRGVFNKLHYLKGEEKGVVTLSAGSHALSLAYAASRIGIPSVAVMPKTTPQDKVKAVEGYGMNVILADGNLRSVCADIQDKDGFVMIHPFDDNLIIAGQGTIGLEILDELPDIDIVFVPVGGGGLISGVSAAIKSQNPDVKIVGVEPLGSPTMFQSIQKSKTVYLKDRKTVAESLAAPYVGEHTLNYAKKYVDHWVLVSDEEIIEALRFIWKEHKIKVEPAGAVALAAFLFRKVQIPKDSKSVCLLTGGNINEERFNKFLLD